LVTFSTALNSGVISLSYRFQTAPPGPPLLIVGSSPGCNTLRIRAPIIAAACAALLFAAPLSGSHLRLHGLRRLLRHAGFLLRCLALLNS